jgi:hypothetical protein
LATVRLTANASREDIVRAVTPAVVTIETTTGTGTGFFAAPSVLLTNKHVVNGASSVRIRFSDGSTSPGYVSATALDADLALIQVERVRVGQPVLSLGSAKSLQVGEEVLAVGSALGLLQSTVTRGIVSAIRTIGGLVYVQTDAAINPGNSGGPLLDKSGHVVAITTAKFSSAESLGFALAVDHASSLLQGNTSIVRTSETSPYGDSPLDAALNSSMKSESDVLREHGFRQFELAVQALARQADVVDTWWQRYQAACAAKQAHPVVDGRDWFGIWNLPTVPDMSESISNSSFVDREGLAGCRAARTNIVNASRPIRAGMQSAEENARRAGVSNGAVGAVQRKYRMDWTDWER